MKITCSFGSRFSLACVRKSLNLCQVIPTRNAEWKTSPLAGEIASATVAFLPRWPHTCRYALSPNLARPWLLAAHILYPHSSTNILLIHFSMVHEPVGIMDSFLQDIKEVPISWEWPRQFYTIQHTFKSSCYYAIMDCRFSWRRCLISWFICVSVSRQFSFIMSFGHSSFHHLHRSLCDPSLSQISCNDTSFRRSVHSDCSGNRQIIFTNIFEGLNNSLSLFK